MDDLPDRIRRACAEVAVRARHVTIDRDRIISVARGLPEVAAVPAPDPAVHHVDGSPETVAAFTVCLDAINFGSGWWPTVRKRPGRSGYFTMAGGLADQFHAHGHWSALELIALDGAAVADVLGQDRDHELMELFAASLRDVGLHVRDEAGGDFAELVHDAGRSAVALATRLAGWACFADVSPYDGFEVPLYKRAQLCAADLHAAGVADFDDLDRLTAFADNLVPHVLACDGVLVLSEELASGIARGQLLVHDAPEEVELRACAVHAVELIADACDHRLTPAQIDAVLWNRGQAPGYKSRPRPRARTTAY